MRGVDIKVDPRQLAQALLILLVVVLFALIVLTAKGAAPIVIAAFGCLKILYGGLRLVRGRQSLGWPVTSGEVIESDVGVQYHRLAHVGPAWYFPKVRFSYAVNGRSYIGTRYAMEPRSVWSTSEDAAREMAADLQAGRAVTVCYKPDQPEMAVLRPGLGARSRSHYWAIIVAGILIVAFGLFFSLLAV